MAYGFYWIKALGSILVICAGIFSGKIVAGKFETELDELNRCEIALVSLSGEVSYSLSTLPKALSNVGSKVGGNTGALFSMIGNLSGMEQRRTVEEAFNLALEHGQHQKLPNRELEILEVLVKNLGIWGWKEQISFIDVAINELRNYRNFIHEEHVRKAKMYRSIGVLFALGLVIVLL